jgi:CBS domain containing-hemolysin-like protein
MSLIIPFLIIALLILLNGLFVSAEFSIIGVRPSRIKQLVEEGNRTAGWIEETITIRRKTDRYIATAQLGITLASLGLGMYAEPSIAHLLEEPLHDWFGLEGAIVHTISFIFALTLITYLHVVLGEMVPKSLALQNAERMVMFLARPMRFSEGLFALPVAWLNQVGMLALKLFRIRPPDRESRLYTPDELELLVSESYAEGLVDEVEQALVANIFEFTERRVAQVMTPRTLITAIPVDIGEEALIELVTTSPNSRFPVYEENIDQIIGVMHLKDLVRQQLSGEAFDLKALVRQVPFVPGTLLADALLASFKKLHLHMAVVIGEHGGTAGIVTLEDLIEEVVGEVRDEFDEAEGAPLTLVEPGHLVAQGTVLLEDIEEYVTLDPHEHDVQTVGGLVLAALSRPPEPGDTFMIGEVKFQVEAVNGLMVKSVSVWFD